MGCCPLLCAPRYIGLSPTIARSTLPPEHTLPPVPAPGWAADHASRRWRINRRKGMQRHCLMRYLALAGSMFVALAGTAEAQAFGINEIGTCAASRGFAVTGSPCQDASSVFWNPGALPATRGWHVLGGAAVIQIGGTFTQDTTFRVYEGDVPTALVPHAFVQYRGENSKLAYGFAIRPDLAVDRQLPGPVPRQEGGAGDHLPAAQRVVAVQRQVVGRRRTRVRLLEGGAGPGHRPVGTGGRDHSYDHPLRRNLASRRAPSSRAPH